MSTLFSKQQQLYIQLLLQATPKQRQAFIKAADNDFIKRLCEVFFNILGDNVHLEDCVIRQFSKHKQTLYKLSSKRIPLYHKRNLLHKIAGTHCFESFIKILDSITN